jgi:4-methylaminobutanoate oxidase (formaldehyde-forming)
VAIGGEPAGELVSVGWSPLAGACVGLGYVRGAAARHAHAGTPVQIDLWGEAVAATAWDAAVWSRRG